MNCLNCNNSNPDGANFCGECGHKLTNYCFQCNSVNLPNLTYCGNCGYHLTSNDVSSCTHEQFLENKLLEIQRYLPRELAQKVLSKKNILERERKQVTIMFCDMSGFTALSSKIGPDLSFYLIEKIFNILVDKVLLYQGVVNEFRGDGILAFFGAPIALEDAPQRAIRAALTIHREIARLNQTESVAGQFPPILLRIGLNTGPVVVGNVGNDLRVQYTAIGDTINIASRIETITPPGSTCISAETYRLTEGFFRCESLGFKQFKGKSEPIEVYRVISPNNRRTRFDVNAERGLTPFTGRELELLKNPGGIRSGKGKVRTGFLYSLRCRYGKVEAVI